MRRFTLALGVSILLGMTLLIITRPAHAGGVVTNCSNDGEFASKLAGGGSVTFNCGAAIIVLGSANAISADTTIDGGGLITLSGGNADRLFVVNSNVTLTLNNIVLTNGYANADGGAIFNNGHLILNKATIQNSQTTSQGSGGAIVTYGPLEITDSTFANNKAANGGAIYPRYSAAQVTITRSALHDNQTTSTTDGWGGAILVWDGAAVSILNSDLYSNTARLGGAIFNSFANSSMSLRDTQVRNNKTVYAGGGIYNENGTATLTDVRVSGNSSTAGDAGGIWNKAGAVTVTDATFSANSAFGYGGGIDNNSEGTITLTNVTLSGNDAFTGGGITNVPGTMSLTNTTIIGNSGLSGIYNANSSVSASHLSLKNVLVATSANDNCNFSAAPDSSLFNLSSDNTCGFGSGRDNVDVMLGPLANNGGPTLTHMPLQGSPAIDNGTGIGCPATDQRGAPRPFGPACDVGSVEYGSTPPTPTPSPTPVATLSPTPSPSPSPTPATTNPPHKQGDLNCDGVIDGRDALRPLRAAADVPLTPPGGCLDLGFGSPEFGDVNCDGSVNAGDTVAILEYATGVPIRPPQQAGCTPIGSVLS